LVEGRRRFFETGCLVFRRRVFFRFPFQSGAEFNYSSEVELGSRAVFVGGFFGSQKYRIDDERADRVVEFND
jgi:hypothetical protein